MRKWRFPEYPENNVADIPKPGRARVTGRSSGIDEFPDNIQKMWTGYLASVSFMDQQLGKILDELETLGLADTTAIIFTSDHGYHLGEHGFWLKDNLHEEVTRVPLIVSVPGMKPGRSSSLVELVDIYPTVCDLLSVPVPDTAQGLSLLKVLEDPGARLRQSALTLYRKHRALRTENFAYIRYESGEEELYDMEKDPGQFTNLAKSKTPPPALAEHGEMLTKRLEEAGLTPKAKD